VPSAVVSVSGLSWVGPVWNDPAIAVQNAIVRYTVGDLSGTAAEVTRALALDPRNETARQLKHILFADQFGTCRGVCRRAGTARVGQASAGAGGPRVA